MAKNRDKKKRRWRLTVIIVAAVFVAALGIYKIKSSRTDADLILHNLRARFRRAFL